MVIYDFISKTIVSLFPGIPSNLKTEYDKNKFNQNIIRIFYLGLFLCIEQMMYALIISDFKSMLQRVYFITSFAMALITAASFYFYKTLNKERQITLFHKFFELIPGMAGIGIILMRILLVDFNGVRLPTIYLAVIYVMAVFVHFSYLQSFIIYSLLSALVIILLPIIQPIKMNQILLADIISNGILAWMIAVVQYNRLINIYLNKKAIEDVNKRLEEKNKEILSMNEELRHISTFDSLTSIYNRRKLEEALSEEIGMCKRYHKDFAVILLDIDRFKSVNDTHGHDVGDRVLIKIAGLIQSNVRELDVCGRWGGEEFLIIVRQSGIDQAFKLAERIRTSIGTYDFGKIAQITASLGVAAWSEIQDREKLLQLSDHRLYAAKAEGRNRVKKD